MSLKNRIVRFLNKALQHLDAEFIRKSELDRLRTDPLLRRPDPLTTSISLQSIEDLRYTNPRLRELLEGYSKFDEPVIDRSRWTSDYVRSQVDLASFRADNAYVFSDRNTEVQMALTSYYVRSTDRLDLFGRLQESGSFGATGIRFTDPDTLVTRDLLDSILEINFLEKHLQISRIPNLKVVDIGAGYGRLAHRLIEALPNVQRVLCTDAVAESTFLCEYFLKYQGIDAKATVVPVTRVQSYLPRQASIALATNIHSFSEYPIAAVSWWLQLIRKCDIPYVFLVPNASDHGGTELLSQEADGSHVDLHPTLSELGYCQLAMEPKYLDPLVQQFGVSPTHYHLFGIT